MCASTYTLDAWRRFKEGRGDDNVEPLVQTLADIPADAEMDDNITIGFWNGKRFASWETWITTVAPSAFAAPAEVPDAVDE